MATESQINANRENAKHSTGPVTDAGREASSKNRLNFGLYTRQDYVKPEEREIYKEFCDGLLEELNPTGLLEQILAAEITTAAWRLRRCALADASLADYAGQDPLLDANKEKTIRSIERARSAAQSAFNRAMNQLRKLQTQRQIGFELLGEDQSPSLVDFAEVSRALSRHQKGQKTNGKTLEQQEENRQWQEIMNYVNSGMPPESL